MRRETKDKAWAASPEQIGFPVQGPASSFVLMSWGEGISPGAEPRGGSPRLVQGGCLSSNVSSKSWMARHGLGMRPWKQNGLRRQPGPFGPFPEGINHGRVILNEVREMGPFPGWRSGDPGPCPGFACNPLYNPSQLCLLWLSFKMKKLPINTSKEHTEYR